VSYKGAQARGGVGSEWGSKDNNIFKNECSLACRFFPQLSGCSIKEREKSGCGGGGGGIFVSIRNGKRTQTK
jgi:hypothetical protein